MSRSGERRARKAALWLLYAIDVTNAHYTDALSIYRESMDDVFEADKLNGQMVEHRVKGVIGNLEELDEKLQVVSPRWKLSRMAPIDRNILRLGAFEILIDGALPLPVINACVDLGKEYGEKRTGGFVNGLLDELCSQNDIVLRT